MTQSKKSWVRGTHPTKTDLNQKGMSIMVMVEEALGLLHSSQPRFFAGMTV